MRIAIAAIGRMKQGPERELVARYLDRAKAAGKPLALTGFDVLEFAESRAATTEGRKADEASTLRSARRRARRPPPGQRGPAGFSTRSALSGPATRSIANCGDGWIF